MSTTRNSFAERFERAYRELGAVDGAAAALLRLRAAYAEPHRHYHTLEHIEACVAWLDWTWASAQRPHEILLALAYHDAVYDPLAGDNEARSAEWARRDLSAAGVASDAVERIAALILATRDHASSERDAALLIDIDLSILGAPAHVYERFERAVRAEYAMFEDAVYALGRAAVLERLASRQPLYATPLIDAELGDRARANLACAIAHWRGVG
jgi:predicted metal-dependent HD superfamily phosphohydrolase